MFSFLLILMITDVIEAQGFSHCCTCFTVIFLLLCFCSNHKNTLRNHFRLDNLVFFGQAWSFFLWVGLVEWVRWDVRACIWSFFYISCLGLKSLLGILNRQSLQKVHECVRVLFCFMVWSVSILEYLYEIFFIFHLEYKKFFGEYNNEKVSTL